ncbi:MAG: hypothetical protein AB7O73_07330 [Bacteroidia bacterium]
MYSSSIIVLPDNIRLVDSIEFEHTQLNLYDNDLLIVRNNDNFHYEVKHLEEVLHAMEGIGLRKKKTLIIMGKYTTISKEAREFRATEIGTIFSSKEAIVISSIAQRILVDFYIKINKPKVPTKLFVSEYEALKWLLNDAS